MTECKIVLIATAIAGPVIVFLVWWIGYMMGRTAQMKEDRKANKNFQDKV